MDHSIGKGLIADRHHDGNEETGLRGSVLEAEFFNMVGDELVTLVEAAGITPDYTLRTQVRDSVIQIANDQIAGTFVTPQMFGARGDGSVDDSAAFQAALTAAGNGAGMVIVPRGRYVVAGVTIPDRVSVAGNGATLVRGPNAQHILAARSGAVIDGITFNGTGQGARSTEDNAIVSARASQIRISNCTFTGTAGAAIYITGCADSWIADCVFDQTPFRGNPLSSMPDVYLAEDCKRVALRGCRFMAHRQMPKNIGLLVAASTTGVEATDINISDNHFDGYSRSGIITTDEAPEAKFGTGRVTIADNIVLNSGMQGIKIKNTGNVVCTGNIVDGYEKRSPENLPSGLSGGIHLNAGGTIACVGNQVRGQVGVAGVGNSSMGIRCAGAPTLGGYDGQSFPRSGFVVSNNMILNTEREAITIGAFVYDAVVDSNVCRDTGGGIYVYSDDQPGRVVRGVTVRGNRFRRQVSAAGAGRGYFIFAAEDITLSDNTTDSAAGTGIEVRKAKRVSINGGSILNSGKNGSPGYGLVVSESEDIMVSNLRVTNTDGEGTQHFGLGFNRSNRNVSISSSNFTGNTKVGLVKKNIPTNFSVSASQGID